jgi:hypothetical protein
MSFYDPSGVAGSNPLLHRRAPLYGGDRRLPSLTPPASGISAQRDPYSATVNSVAPLLLIDTSERVGAAPVVAGGTESTPYTPPFTGRRSPR